MAEENGGLPRPVIIVAVALCGLLAAGVATLGLLFGSDEPTEPAEQNGSTEPLAIPSVPTPDAETPECEALLDELPRQLTSSGEQLRSLRIAEPQPPATRAWGSTDHEPLIARCGVQRPGELTRTSPLREVSGVQWLVAEQPGSATWYAVDRKVYIALSTPSDSGTGPLQTVSEQIDNTLERVDISFD
ncbi:uncharacterized protein DUF3515 [Tamaricihabitans halophyticus]|uniref:Uncharacterized protein DUF3515 n=1 Tax=Tamaricihabitans halophyticus TaxID=1262583 RepID=A0A4R2QSD6_9PSEU|nr:DUF3515 domain-containing protein [Tamaricihabitans halophyticus]TCP52034.1 uncharacterized protein DUF3515 [Tamaricihabitans halophyticus]